jgi:NAD-dependent SIR2 family protein deacetylase
MERQLQQVVEHLSHARSVLFITGAGISAESGVPTYRGIGGLYEGFDVVFSIGTTSHFPYITAPVLNAVERGKATVEINPEHTALSQRVAVRLQTGAVAACEALWDLWAHRSAPLR